MGIVRDLVTRFGADTTGFTKGADEVKSSLITLNKSFYENKSVMKETSAELKSLESEQKKLKEAMKDGGTSEQKAQFQELSAKIDATKLKMAQLKTEEQDIKSKISNATSELKKQNTELKDTSTQSEKAQSSVGNLGNALKLLVTGYTGKKLFDVLIGTNADMEQYVTSFTVMLQDEEKAKSLMNDITKMAANTPFELTDIAGVGQLLMNYGVEADNVIDEMTKLGDLSQGNAQKFERVALAYGQMLAKGKVTGEELRQMTEAGVPLLNTLADSMGKTTAEITDMVSKGKVGIPELDNAIASLTTGTGKFAGMMEEQSKTFNGLLSTAKDNLTALSREAGEETFETVKGKVYEFIDILKSDEIQDAAKSIGRTFGDIATALAAVIKIGWEFKEVIIGGIVAVKGYAVISSVMSSVKLGIESLSIALETTTIKQLALNTATKAFSQINPYALVATAMAALIAVGIKLVSEYDDINKVLEKNKKITDDIIEKSKDNYSSTEKEITNIKRKAERYEELRQETERTASQEKELHDIAIDLQAVLPDGTVLIDAQTGAYNALGSSIENVINNMRIQAQLQSNSDAYADLINQKRKLQGDINDYSEEQNKKSPFVNNSPTINPIKGISSMSDAIAQGNQERENIANQQAIDDIDKKLEELDKEAEALKSWDGKTSVANLLGTNDKLTFVKSDDNNSDDILKSIIGSNSSDTSEGIVDPSFLDKDTFKERYQNLKFKKDMEDVTDTEYYDTLEKMLSQAQAEGNEEYNQYFVELHKGRQSLADASTKLAEKAGKEAASAAESALKEEEKLRQDALTKDKNELEKFCTDSTNAYKESINKQKEAYKEYYEEKKKAAEKSLDAQKEAIDNEISSLENATKEKIELINAEKDAEKEKLQLKLDAIDKEIEARKRLQEDTDINKEIDAVKARLTYSQLDDFSRMELEKQLSQLSTQKEETEWQRSKADEKEAIQNEINSSGTSYDKQIEDLNAQLENEKAMAEERKTLLEEQHNAYIATLDDERDKLLEALDVQQDKLEKSFGYIAENFNSLAELHATRIEDVFDLCVDRSKQAILELQAATDYANQMAAQLMSAAQNSSYTSYDNSSTNSITNNFSSPYLTADQIGDIITEKWGDG